MGTICGYPLDTVKVRIQTQDVSKKLQYTGTFQTFAKICREEGVGFMIKHNFDYTYFYIQSIRMPFSILFKLI